MTLLQKLLRAKLVGTIVTEKLEILKEHRWTANETEWGFSRLWLHNATLDSFQLVSARKRVLYNVSVQRTNLGQTYLLLVRKDTNHFLRRAITPEMSAFYQKVPYGIHKFDLSALSL